MPAKTMMPPAATDMASANTAAAPEKRNIPNPPHPLTLITNIYSAQGGCSDFLQKKFKNLRGARAVDGSTMVGVLAALVFITVVASLMVKNTGAQSAASIGYGSAMIMQSTASSGVWAAEAQLADGDVTEDVLTMISTYQENNKSNPIDGKSRDTSIFLHGTTAQRASLGAGTGQYFSSKVRNYNRTDKNLWVEVNSGKNASGKGLKRALAFYHIGGMGAPIVTPPIKDGQQYSPQNAIYMKGPFKDGNYGLNVKGNATFEEEVKFQNASVTIDGEAYFEKDVLFLVKDVHFKNKVFFNGNVDFQNLQPINPQIVEDMFIKGQKIGDNNVGVYGKFTALNTTINIPDNFYINGAFGSTTTGVSGVNVLYHTSKLDLNTAIIKNTTDKKSISFANSDDMLAKMTMGNLASRQETPLNINNIPTDIRVKASAVTNGSSLDVDLINSVRTTQKSANKLYNGHLVVEIDDNVSVTADKMVGKTFNDSVIFIINNGGTINANGEFYRSGEKSSTMIYVGEGNATLNQFGSDGLFRGLIYIDEKNTSPNNKFQWKEGSKFLGAFHNFSKMPFLWNSANQAKPLEMTFDKDVVSAFGTLVNGYKPNPSGGNSAGSVEEHVDGSNVDLISLGYYFY